MDGLKVRYTDNKINYFVWGHQRQKDNYVCERRQSVSWREDRKKWDLKKYREFILLFALWWCIDVDTYTHMWGKGVLRLGMQRSTILGCKGISVAFEMEMIGVVEKLESLKA